MDSSSSQSDNSFVSNSDSDRRSFADETSSSSDRDKDEEEKQPEIQNIYSLDMKYGSPHPYNNGWDHRENSGSNNKMINGSFRSEK